jgi:hypothetical protein
VGSSWTCGTSSGRRLMAPASLPQQLRGGAWDPGALDEHARRSNWLLMTPTRSRAVRSAYRHSNH